MRKLSNVCFNAGAGTTIRMQLREDEQHVVGLVCPRGDGHVGDVAQAVRQLKGLQKQAPLRCIARLKASDRGKGWAVGKESKPPCA